jgi:hypothetical protein
VASTGITEEPKLKLKLKTWIVMVALLPKLYYLMVAVLIGNFSKLAWPGGTLAILLILH